MHLADDRGRRTARRQLNRVLGSRPMPQVPKREFWNNAEPERLPDAWTLTKVKGDRTLTAVCQVWAVELGWNVRVVVEASIIHSSLCRSGAEMIERAEFWLGPM